MPDLVPTYLIEENIFYREGIKSLLTEADFEILTSHTHFSELLQNDPAQKLSEPDCQSKNRNHLIILGIEDGKENMQEAVHALKNAFPHCRIAILTALEDMDYITCAFASGADGCILRSVSPSAFIGALNMIAMGEKIYPASILNKLVQYNYKNHNSFHDPTGNNLSAREAQILSCLADGRTNKEVARDLSIQEATVKVHIKTLLRKLGLSNRTQAAVWAVNKGLLNPDSANDRDFYQLTGSD